jgi:beta-lactamase class A
MMKNTKIRRVIILSILLIIVATSLFGCTRYRLMGGIWSLPEINSGSTYEDDIGKVELKHIEATETPKPQELSEADKLISEEETSKDSKITEEEIKTPVETAKPKNEENTPVEKSINDFEQLKIHLEAMTKNKGDWSIYIKDLKSGEELSINNKKMVAASTIKLFIMAKLYEDIYEGNLEKSDSVMSMMGRMITRSHNDSSNKLVQLLGRGSHEEGMSLVNDYANRINCLDTLKQRRFYDSGPPAGAKENYTSAEDCGRLLEKIYNRECVSSEYDNEMLNLLLEQERRSKLPALLPKKVRVAHKTGELSRTEHDVGIVFGSKTDYIICVMSRGLNSSEDGRALIAEISKTTYNYFEGIK